MHHALVVRVGKGVDHLAEHPQGLRHGQLALPVQLGAERLAVDVRHDVVQQIVVGARGEQRDDVGMLQLGGELDLPLEPLLIHLGGHLGRQHLDDHLARESDLLGEEDATHPAAAQLALDAVGVTQGGGEAGFEVGGHLATEDRDRAADA